MLNFSKNIASFNHNKKKVEAKYIKYMYVYSKKVIKY